MKSKGIILLIAAVFLVSFTPKAPQPVTVKNATPVRLAALVINKKSPLYCDLLDDQSFAYPWNMRLTDSLIYFSNPTENNFSSFSLNTKTLKKEEGITSLIEDNRLDVSKIFFVDNKIVLVGMDNSYVLDTSLKQLATFRHGGLSAVGVSDNNHIVTDYFEIKEFSLKGEKIANYKPPKYKYERTVTYKDTFYQTEDEDLFKFYIDRGESKVKSEDIEVKGMDAYGEVFLSSITDKYFIYFPKRKRDKILLVSKSTNTLETVINLVGVTFAPNSKMYADELGDQLGPKFTILSKDNINFYIVNMGLSYIAIEIYKVKKPA